MKACLVSYITFIIIYLTNFNVLAIINITCADQDNFLFYKSLDEIHLNCNQSIQVY